MVSQLISGVSDTVAFSISSGVSVRATDNKSFVILKFTSLVNFNTILGLQTVKETSFLIKEFEIRTNLKQSKSR